MPLVVGQPSGGEGLLKLKHMKKTKKVAAGIGGAALRNPLFAIVKNSNSNDHVR